MIDLFPTVLAASTVKSIGAVIAVLTIVGFIWYIAANVRAGRAEVASEIELAPNRKPYYDDEGLEGPRLTSALSTGLILLAVCAIGLPLYWLAEPSRMDGAIAQFDSVFVSRGSKLFATTEEGGYNCAGCHGGMEAQGGVAPPFTLTGADGEFDATVSWQAPALNTVLLRYSEEEVRDILVYGRPGTPMPAWGAEGGGPLTTQQIDELIAYLGSIQVTPDEARAEIEKGLRLELGLEEGAAIDYTDPAVGQALFTLGVGDGPSAGLVSGGAFSCARCHTKGASLVPGTELPLGADLSEHVGFPQGSGALGPSLRYTLVPRQFLTAADLADFIRKGSVNAMLYGQRGQGSGRMPGFGDNPNTVEEEGDGMYSDEMVLAVAIYEANLHVEADAAGGAADQTGAAPLTIADATTTTTTAPAEEAE
jgi:mono/diheme cytochrome c family protein